MAIEYKEEHICGVTSNEMPIDDFIKVLKRENKNGWEYCGMYGMSAIFKRPAQEAVSFNRSTGITKDTTDNRFTGQSNLV